MSYHPLEQGDYIKDRAAQEQQRFEKQRRALSPEEQANFEKKFEIAKLLAAREQRARIANAVAEDWKGGRTRRLKKRRATRRAKKRTRRPRS